MPAGVFGGIFQSLASCVVACSPGGVSVIRKASKRVGRKTNVCHFEPLEDRRLLSASLSVAQSIMVFNAVKNSGASYTETLALTDTGDANLTLGSSGVSIVNDPTFATQDAARFNIVN